MRSKLAAFFAELRRRKVVRVAIAYSVVGFVLWQAAEIAFPALGLPPAALTFIVAVTVFGFPLAVMLSWAYELRPEEPRDLAAARVLASSPAPLPYAPDLRHYAASATIADGPGPAGSRDHERRSTLRGDVLKPFDDTPRRILVVDDDEDARQAHAALVEGLGHDVETAADGIEALAKLSLDVDLVMLDADMPGMDGFQVAQQIRSDPEHAPLPIIMVSGLAAGPDRARAVEVGINDFISKPLDPREFELRAKWLLQLKTAHDRLRDQHGELARAVERKTVALRSALEEMTEARRVTEHLHLDAIRRLTLAAELVDSEAAGHVRRIGLYSETLWNRLGLPPEDSEIIRHASPLHDVGKIAVPAHVLMKPGDLNAEEWELMKTHTTVGARILEGSLSPVVQMGEAIARFHHERWDGGGYPSGIAGEGIPVEARICAVVDCFDVMTMDRPQRRAIPMDEAVRTMTAESGSQFDPAVLAAFLAGLSDLAEIQAEAR